MRSLAALLSVAAAYVLLRGHPDSWPPVVRACVAVVALFAGLGCWAVAKGTGLPVLPSRRRAVWIDSLVLGAVVLGIEVAFVGFFRAAPEPLETMAAKVEEWLRPEASRKRRLEEAGERAAGSGNWLWNDEGRRPLPRRTNFKPGNRPEVFLRPAGDAGPLLDDRIYVHAFAMAGYADGAWSPGGGEGRRLTAGNDGWVRLGAPPERRPVAGRVFLGKDPNGQNPVVGVQGMMAVRLPEVRRSAPGHLLLPASDGEGYEYDVVSYPRSLDDVAAAAAAGSGAAPECLALPGDSLGARISHFTEVVSGEGPPVERLLRIRNHLRTTLDYSLVTENPDNRDPLENFLFEEQRGHCEFFATAAALMARAAGVPSRVCYGWTGGTYYEGSNLFVFRAREAHAWAEVLLEGEGWVVLDPTPPSAFLHGRPDLAPPDEAPPGVEDVAGVEDEVAPAARLLPWVLGLAGLAALPVVLLGVARRRRDPGGGFGESAPPVVSYVRLLERACRRRGVRCYPGRTLRSMIAALGEPPDFAGELLGYHYALRYEGGARDREVERRLAVAIRGWDDQFRE